MNWTDLPRDRAEWQALVDTVMNTKSHKMFLEQLRSCLFVKNSSPWSYLMMLSVAKILGHQ